MQPQRQTQLKPNAANEYKADSAESNAIAAAADRCNNAQMQRSNAIVAAAADATTKAD
jgi:hypothetical protein